MFPRPGSPWRSLVPALQRSRWRSQFIGASLWCLHLALVKDRHADMPANRQPFHELFVRKPKKADVAGIAHTHVQP